MSLRRAVRVVLVDDDHRVLLLWHEAPHDDPHWAPPGGGIDEGETPEEAAARELVEEVGLRHVGLSPPRWRWRHAFSFAGEPVIQEELIYLARVPRFVDAGTAAGRDSDGIVRSRWWALSELATTDAAVWPPALGSLVASALDRPAPEAPLDLPGT